jgi:hypothetical protein
MTLALTTKTRTNECMFSPVWQDAIGHTNDHDDVHKLGVKDVALVLSVPISRPSSSLDKLRLRRLHTLPYLLTAGNVSTRVHTPSTEYCKHVYIYVT